MDRPAGLRRTLIVYGLAVTAVLAVSAIRFAVTPLIGEAGPLILYIVPVVMIAWFGGLWPALFTTVLGCVFGLWLFAQGKPDNYHALLPYWVGRGFLFILVGILISALASTLQRERRRTQISEERLRLIFESVQDYAIFTTNLRGLITSWNIGAERVFGFTESEIVGQSAELLYTDSDRGTGLASREMDTAMVEGRTLVERWLLRKNGTRLLAGGVITPLRDEAGQPVGFTRICRDITDYYNAQQEREQLLVSERAARAEAERISRMKDEFLATLGHELRTPLNAILGWSQILKHNPGDIADVTQGIAVIERNARAQAQIVDDLLDMSRIISGKVRLNVQQIDLAAVTLAAIETARPAAQAKGVSLDTNVSAHQPVLTSGDANRMQQVLWNLLSNAVKFTPKGGRIDVNLELLPSEIVLTIADTGEGISPTFLPFVFDRFRQADGSSARRYGGLGLGLSIVKQIVELHGGTVAVASPGTDRGSTFTVHLPVQFTPPTLTEAEQAAPAALRADAAWHDDITLAGLHVLVVDDEADARALVRRLLEDRNATVATASSCAEALAYVQQKRPDLLVSDIGMPEEDGYVLIRRLRSLPPEAGGQTPAIALTAYARAEDRVKAVVGGFQMHIAKPVEPSELIAMVASLGGRTNG